MRILHSIFAALCALGFAASAAAEDFAIVGAKLYPAPDAAPIPDSVILVHEGRIRAAGARARTPIPAGYRILNREGHVVTAGFWNSHVHLAQPDLALFRPDTLSDEALSQIMETMFTRWGFTTVFDVTSVLASTNAIRARIAAGRVRGPTILTVGEPFYPAGGTPYYVRPVVDALQLPSYEIQSTEQALARVERQIREGADGVKLYTGSFVSLDGEGWAYCRCRPSRCARLRARRTVWIGRFLRIPAT